jgi:hypothetical protein
VQYMWCISGSVAQFLSAQFSYPMISKGESGYYFGRSLCDCSLGLILCCALATHFVPLSLYSSTKGLVLVVCCDPVL